jgi:hypothetical protein
MKNNGKVEKLKRKTYEKDIIDNSKEEYQRAWLEFA